MTTTNTGAYTRYIYGPNYVVTLASVNNVADEAYTNTVFDGMGRTVGVASNNPGSTGGYKAQTTQYDAMGRAVKRSNPVEIDGSWNPAGDDSAGWLYTGQSYDWKGRPLVTTNTDGTQSSANYDGCGCAGGEVVTLTDEVGRQQKVYSDSLGRQWKAEVLNWDGSVYSTTEKILNVLNQPAFVRQFQGTDQSGVYQETAIGYDGYGRLQSKHSPDQDAGHSTSYSYNPDDTLYTVTDARGAVATYSYNDNRRLVTGVSYSAPSGISVPPTASFSYDAAGNRSSMTTSDGGGVTYGYNSLNKLTSESRQFPGLSGTYTLSYQYNLAGAIQQVGDPTGGTSFAYTFDTAGQVTAVTSAGMGASAALASNAQYRAWGALKHADYGNGTGVTLGYNGRGMASSYSLSGAKDLTMGQVRPEGGGFQYYADGRVQFASDYQSDAQTYGIQDRAYSYDHTGRLSNALTGTDARNFVNNVSSNVGDGPYAMAYTYNEWDNQLSRAGRYWSQDDIDNETFAASTGRNPAWSYDADGRLVSRNEQSPNGLTYVPAHYSFDAAGWQAQTTQTTSRMVGIHQNILQMTAVTQTYTYDGDGLGVEQVTTKQVNSNQPTSAATYYLRSTVLSGKIVSEYNSSGVRQASYAWSGASVIAQQTGADTSMPTLRWEHVNPVTGDGRETDPSGLITKATHLDPDGVDAGESDPFASAAGDPDVGGMSQSAIDARVSELMPSSLGGGSTQCLLDGVETACGLTSSLVSMGAASEVIDVSYYATVRKGQDVLFSGFVGRGQMEVGSFLGSSPIGTEANITATISPQQAASLASSGDYRSYLSSQLGLGGSRWVDTGTSSVSGYSEAWDGTNVSISMTVTGTTSGFFENDDQQKLEEKKAAATVASGVEAALQVLAKGCWDPNSWNSDVSEGDRNFAKVQNADKYTRDWKGVYSTHNNGSKESAAIVDFGIHPNSDTERGLLPPGIEINNYSLVLKYYPGEGMAVTANTDSMEHAYAWPGFATGLVDVNVKFAKQLLEYAPKCK